MQSEAPSDGQDTILLPARGCRSSWARCCLQYVRVPSHGCDSAEHAVISALSSRYIPIVLFPYYLALGAQLLSSLYALLFVPETLSKVDDHESIASESVSDEEEETMMEAIVDHVVEPVMEAVTEPIKPLALLLPHRGKNGSLEWRLFILTMSLLATTSGVCSKYLVRSED